MGKTIQKKLEELFGSIELVYTRLVGEMNGTELITYSVVIPNGMLDDLIDKISNTIDQRKKESMITVYDVVASVSPYLTRLQEKSHGSNASPNPLEAILQPLNKSLKIPDADVLIMVIIATIIALAGLFLNNVAIIIGAMLIAPLLNPINAVAVNASLGRVKNVFKAETYLTILLVTSILVAAVTTYAASLISTLEVGEQILLRGNVTLLDIIFAVLLGVAGGMAIVSFLPQSLVGVAVAVALIPPNTVTGIGIALGSMELAIGALLLTLTNLFGLKAGGILILLLKGVSPRHYYEKRNARRYGAYSLLLFSLILVVLMLLILLAGF